ncbi:PF07588 family protein [Leptospira kirschneri str. JB]|uniref:endostatin-like outer membrane lipoprotein LenC n=1 Tax=Leptospira kirschneri TaxID=29507 RepID=UPI0002BD3E37|nr:DUF1554 domain-containing protein [Leptospira kirschneri]EMJ92355.1 PF07588 family protein [Leptospira kirschneri str. JB]
MKIKYKIAVVSVFTLVFVACFNKSSGDDNLVLSGLLSLISDKQTLGSTTLSKNQLSGQNLQSVFPESYVPYIFTTSSFGVFHNANFGGIAGADAFCQNHIPSNIPNTGQYKAMIVDGVNRVATTVGPNSTAGQKDWVFQPNQQYRRAEDGANVMFTNSSGMIDFQSGKRLENSFTQVKESGQWTSLNTNWTTWISNGYPSTCNSWNSDALNDFGIFGSSTRTDSDILAALISANEQVGTSCSLSIGYYGPYNLGLVCVEQPRPKYIFVTSSTEEWHNGNFGGIAGADAYCQSQVPSNLPSGGIYKAMIVDGVNRVATTVGPNSTVGQKDWVLRPNQQYLRDYDDVFIMTTNSSGMFDFANNNQLENSFSQVPAAQWTGLNSDWTVWKSGGIPITCNSWNSNDLSVYGVYGMANSKNSNTLKAEESNGAFTTSCSHKFTSYGNYRIGLVCVEQ